MALSVQYWANYCHGQTKLQRRSENAVRSNHVLQFIVDKDLNVVHGSVQASLRNRAYSVQVRLIIVVLIT